MGPLAKSVAIVFDDKTRRVVEAIARELGLSCVDIVNVAALKNLPESFLVACDLSNSTAIGALRDLRKRAADKHVHFAIPQGDRRHFFRVQANALGASGVYSGALEPASVFAYLKKAFATDQSLGADLAATMGATAGLITATFDVIAKGAPLDVDNTLNAGTVLLNGVSQSGLTSWLDAVRSHHQGTLQHCLLVAGTVAAWAAQAGLRGESALRLSVAALLHDVGKAGIPKAVLDKPSKLDANELSIMRRHPVLGHEYLVRQGGLAKDVLFAVRHHHELLDGSGYPDRLRGDDIPPMTRILTVCDIYAALVERRSYKPPRPPATALLILLEMAEAGQLDQEIVAVLASSLGFDLQLNAIEAFRKSHAKSA